MSDLREKLERLPPEATILWCPHCGHAVLQHPTGKTEIVNEMEGRCDGPGTLRQEMVCEALAVLGCAP